VDEIRVGRKKRRGILMFFVGITRCEEKEDFLI
jgi:hypothetical protein